MRRPFVASSLRGSGGWADDKGLKETKASVVKWSRDLGTIAGAGNTIGVSIGCGGRDEYDIPKTLRREKNMVVATSAYAPRLERADW